MHPTLHSTMSVQLQLSHTKLGIHFNFIAYI